MKVGATVEGGRASEASHLGERWHLESRSPVGPGPAELW